MHTTNLISEISPRPRLNWMAALALLGLLAAGCSQLSLAQGAQPQAFSTPGEATHALFQAIQKSDEKALEKILGGDKEVTSSSDETVDKLERERFSQKYLEMHRLVQEPDGNTVLYIGAENWPFPIPLVSKKGGWFFDSASGKQEILFRTVGENEATAIQVCREFAMARKRDGAKAASEDAGIRFAENLVSAGAANSSSDDANLFYGYYFRTVSPASAVKTNGTKKARGLALVAYPAKYRGTGVMTFVVADHGIVYEKDFGSTTATVAPQIHSRAGSGWRPTA